MNIYFGCTGTLIDGEGNVRRYADFVLKELSKEGHRMFLMESDKNTATEQALKKSGLFRYFEGIVSFGADDPAPDYVIDAAPDHFEADTPGYQVPYFNQYAMLDDDELLEAYRQIRRIEGKSGPPPRRDVSDWTSRRSKP
jgi:hypothetical protein